MWQDVISLFNWNTSNFVITTLQARNKWTALKAKYQLVLAIRDHVSGVGWNEVTCQISMPRRSWIDLVTGLL